MKLIAVGCRLQILFFSDDKVWKGRKIEGLFCRLFVDATFSTFASSFRGWEWDKVSVRERKNIFGKLREDKKKKNLTEVSLQPVPAKKIFYFTVFSVTSSSSFFLFQTCHTHTHTRHSSGVCFPETPKSSPSPPAGNLLSLMRRGNYQRLLLLLHFS